MGAMATLMASDGHDVRGSDAAVYPPMSSLLARAGISVMSGYDPANLEWGPDAVVVGNVCRKDHPEVLAAQQKKIPLTSFPQLLGEKLLEGRRSLVVTGTHGKTTTTSLLAWLLDDCGGDPSWLIGGVPLNRYLPSHLGQGETFVVEGDEYDTAFFDKESKFLHYRPHRAILTSLEFDHADIFSSMEEIRRAFTRFVELIPSEGSLLVYGEEAEAVAVAKHARCPVHSYGVLGPDEEPGRWDFSARVESRNMARRSVFEWFCGTRSMGQVTTHLTGKYNIANALAALALAKLEGFEAEALNAALSRYRGVKRRQELAGIARGVRVIDDFAHHPTAVHLTVDALRRRHPNGTLHVCFEPRSATSRRKRFASEFAQAFGSADRVYLGPLHAPESIPPEERLDTAELAEQISAQGTPAKAFAKVDAIVQELARRAGPGDSIVVLSSGSFGGLVTKLLSALGDAVTRAMPDDLEEINALLHGYKLPPIQEPSRVESLVIRDETGAMVGCVNLEVHGHDCFFFGLAVARGRRGEGLGWMLADFGNRRARALGARFVYLVTSDSADFFATRGGFDLIPLSEFPPSVLQSPNFRATHHSSMHGMRHDLKAKRK